MTCSPLRHLSSRPARLLATVAAVLALFALAATVQAPFATADSTADAPKPTVVLVHGAFADASGFNAVIERLLEDGYPVIAPANPLRGVDIDAAAVASVLATIEGPIVLVGHSYGGAVITAAAAGNSNVKALVYVAAFAPDTGESILDLAGKFPGSKLGDAVLPRPFVLPDGTEGVDVYVAPDQFREVFAADLSEATAAVMAATQRPAALSGFATPFGEAVAWKDIPSWYLIPQHDNTLPPDAQRFMAERADATAIEVDAAHAVMVSRPAWVFNIIRTAADAVS